MSNGVLEVFLVGAEGFKNTSFFRNPCPYVLIQCGNQEYKSKITSGKGKKALWNEKFIFKIPALGEKNSNQLVLQIMDSDIFTGEHFLGETIIHLGGVLTEGSEKGSILLKATPHNIVLADRSYAGLIRVGLKFTSNVEMQIEEREFSTVTIPEKNIQPKSRNFFTFPQIPWPRFCSLENPTYLASTDCRSNESVREAHN